MKQSRREFVKNMAVGATGITLGGMSLNASAYNNILGANDRVNVAIVGLGRRLGAFEPPIANKKYNIRLAYLCDVMKSQRENAAKRFSEQIRYSPKLEEDVRNIHEDPDVDAIINATPDHWHAPETIYAVQSGKHVYVEKPCSHNPYEGEMLTALSAKYDKVIQMGNQQRSSLESNEIVKEIQNGAIGNPYKAVAFYSNSRGRTPNPVKQAPPEGLNWDLFQGPAPRQDYRHDTWNYNWHWYGWTYGTAETGNNAVHELDIARWALQVGYPERVEVNADKNHFTDDGWTMYDTMYGTLYYPNGKSIIWDGKSRNGYSTYGSGRGTIIYGSEGSVFVNREGYRLFDRGGNLVKEKMGGTDEAGTALGGGGDMSTMHVVNFVNAIRGTETSRSPITEGVISTHMGHMMNIAYRIGKGFDIDVKTGRAYDREAIQIWSREYEKGWKPVV